MHDVKKITLKNGLRAVFVKMPDSPSTTVASLVRVGADYESAYESGLSHFLEHICFDGTKNLPTALEVSAAFENLGAAYNAYTDREITSYFAKVANEHALKAFDLVADFYINPLFDPKEVEKERGVIVEELNMYEDNPQMKVWRLFEKLMYGENPRGRDIGGTKETVNAFTREDIVAHHARHYIPENTVLLVSGNFDESAMEDALQKSFSGLKNGKSQSKEVLKDEQDAPRELITFKDTDQTKIVIGFKGFADHDPRRYALFALTNILGGGASSRLFQRIREKMGAAYSVNAGEELYTDYGYAVITAGLNHGKVKEALAAIMEECSLIRDKGVSGEELSRAKNYITGHFLLDLETSNKLGYFYATRELFGAAKGEATPEEWVKSVKAVTAEEVSAVAKEVLQNKGLNFSLLGPFKKGSFDDIVRL